jgi:hypothetical protein
MDAGGSETLRVPLGRSRHTGSERNDDSESHGAEMLQRKGNIMMAGPGPGRSVQWRLELESCLVPIVEEIRVATIGVSPTRSDSVQLA